MKEESSVLECLTSIENPINSKEKYPPNHIQNLTLEVCVEIFPQIPELILKERLAGIELELTHNNKQCLNKEKMLYRGIALHLDNLVLSNTKNPELKFFKKEKVYAKLSKAILDLATGLSDHWIMEKFGKSKNMPKFVWLRCEAALCERSMRQSGLFASLGLSNTPGELVYKEQFRKENKEVMDLLNTENVFDGKQFLEVTGKKQSSEAEMLKNLWTHPIDFLSVEGYFRAKQDVDFDLDYWQPYQRAWAAFRNLTKSKDIQFSMLDVYGEEHTTEKHITKKRRC